MGEPKCNIETIVCTVVEEVTREGEVAGLNPRSREARDFRTKNEGGWVADQWGPPRVKEIAIFCYFWGI